MKETEEIARQLEQAIDQLPNHSFLYTYASGLYVALWHVGNMWYGEILGTTNLNGVYNASSFIGVYGVRGEPGSLGIADWTRESQQELLDAARNMKDQQDSPLP